MQIDVSNTTVIMVAVALVWYLVCIGFERIASIWYAIQENRRREQDEARRECESEAPRSWLGRRVEMEEKKES